LAHEALRLLLGRWMSATFHPICGPVLYTADQATFIVRFGMSTERPLSPPATDVLSSSRPDSQRNTGEGAESVMRELRRHRRVDDLVNHGPENDPPLPLSDQAVAFDS